MKKLILLAVVLFAGLFIFRNNQLKAQTTEDVAEVDLDAINWQLDSLLPCYHFKPLDSAAFRRDSLNVYNYAQDSLPAYSSEAVAQRLKDLGSPIALDYNEYVQAYINLYTLQRRGQVERMLGLSHLYFPIFEEELDRAGIPIELKYLPIVESALNPHAVSRAGATGLWQFMLATGRLYDLRVTSYLDERRDPYKSTQAAVRYLKRMYKTYGDWLLVIAAYNCGPGNVNKALARSGGGTTFWEIRDNLPRETRGYVPAFIAATYVMSYATEHNLFPKMVDFSFQEDTVHIRRQKVSLQDFAKITHTDVFALKDLNPELSKDIIPYQGTPYILRVPMRTGQFFAAYRDSIMDVFAQLEPSKSKVTYSAKKTSPLTNKPYKAVASTKPTYAGSTAGRTLVYHKVRSGEVVSTIAEKYHVTWKQIQQWNGLRSYRIKPGQRLKVYVSNKYRSAGTSKSSTASTKTTPKASIPKGKEGNYHIVRSGDTLWDIANAYDGVTVEKIKSLNNMTSNRLKIGQALRIK